jgi:diguanylate cyclase (GGDEF)-like protein
MNFDVSTLFFVTIYVESILGLLLLFVWVQNPGIRAVAWWGSAHLMRAGSVTLFGMYGTVPDFISIDFANALLLLSFGLTWSGARVFDRRPVSPFYAMYGALVWLCLSHIAVVAQWPDLRGFVSAGIITAYMWFTAWELSRSRNDVLISRWPTVFMLVAHGGLFLFRTPLSAFLPWGANGMLDSIWLAILSTEALLFTISIAFMLLAMAKERAEQRHKSAAMLDELTGIANRRGFFGECENLRKSRLAGSQTAVLLIDLDNFKAINDRFGHALGDAVIRRFSKTISALIRPSDLFGRVGGEEFALVIRDVGRERAGAIAERMRTAFAGNATDVDGKPVHATVSIGIAICESRSFDIVTLLSEADEALYRAKNGGRNRVEYAAAGVEDAAPPLAPDNVTPLVRAGARTAA